MSAEPTTKPPSAVPNQATAKKADPRRPEMPKIPEVATGSGDEARGSSLPDAGKLRQLGPIVAVGASLAIVLIVWTRSKPHTNADLAPAGPENAKSAAPLPPTPATGGGANVAATTDELAKPWSSKKFVFKKPYSQESVNAMVIRLPEGGLWAFSLKEPYGTCDLEYVTDLGKLAAQYGYQATHPMVGNSCKGVLYDPLKVGPLGGERGDTWARGEIVKGSALRPPFSIDVKESDRSIIADAME